MLPISISLNCTEKDRQYLKRIFNNSAGEISKVEPEKIVMGCLAGKRNNEIAAGLDISMGPAAIWPKRFVAEDMKGLCDCHRYGKPPEYYPFELHGQQFKQIKQSPPYAGQAIWDDGLLAEALIVFKDAAWGILDVQHHQRHRRFCLSADPEILPSKTLRGSFTNKEQLTRKPSKILLLFTDNVSLFVRRKREAKGSQLPNGIVNLCN
jgi:hypothetical protein